jgi:7,8-dihydro-6-hydroxymethylpterin-pyrophosphokinase
VHWGPRPLDIDILYTEYKVAHHPDLQVPHPRLEERRFVLEPLAEIAPGLVLPSGRTVEEALALVMDQRVERLGSAAGE